MRHRYLLLPLLLAATPAVAETEHDAGLWINTTVQGPVDDRIVYFAEVQPRVTQDVSRLSQLLLRGALGVRLTDTVTLYQGFAHIEEPQGPVNGRNEERPFQQLSWTLRSDTRTNLQSRTRLEERFRSDGPGLSLRLRQMIRYSHALAPGAKRVRALGSIEGFVGLTSADWGGTEGFDQVRTFLGVEVPLLGASTIEAGYLNQTVDAPGSRVRMAHIASLSLFVRH